MVPCFKGVIVGLKMYITLSLKDGLYLLELYDGYRLFLVCVCSRFVCIDFKPWCGLGWRPLTLGVAPGECGIVTNHILTFYRIWYKIFRDKNKNIIFIYFKCIHFI